ncbi:Protein LIPS-15 [Aphelenchoides avenae]|nr:Protein LIPS-15 [Aphelenchus avenae]
MEQLIARDDLGWFGSFGGGNHTARTKTQNVPVIYVHGGFATAGELTPLREYFLKRGYADEEVYGTSYGNGKLSDLSEISLKCINSKGVRMLIEAVSAYTDSPVVNVVGYSMGSPTSRKAILGGRCVDSITNLGPPLTDYIRTFLSVAGANHGSQLCDNPDGLGTLCSNVVGLTCQSEFYADINSR